MNSWSPNNIYREITFFFSNRFIYDSLFANGNICLKFEIWLKSTIYVFTQIMQKYWLRMYQEIQKTYFFSVIWVINYVGQIFHTDLFAWICKFRIAWNTPECLELRNSKCEFLGSTVSVAINSWRLHFPHNILSSLWICSFGKCWHPVTLILTVCFGSFHDWLGASNIFHVREFRWLKTSFSLVVPTS